MYKQLFPFEAYKDIVELYRAAANAQTGTWRVQSHNNLLLTGILQSSELTRRIIAHSANPSASAQEHLALRAQLVDYAKEGLRRGTLAMQLVLPEEALRRSLQELEARDNLLHMLGESHASLELRIIPTAAGFYPGFEVCWYHWEAPNGAQRLFVNQVNPSTFSQITTEVTQPGMPSEYKRFFGQLQAAALSPEETQSFIERL